MTGLKQVISIFVCLECLLICHLLIRLEWARNRSIGSTARTTRVAKSGHLVGLKILDFFSVNYSCDTTNLRSRA
jgi:hypothetical protein